MKLLSKFIPIIFLIVLVVIFFGKTLIGSQIFVTPDFGQSDILHNEYPAKYFISASLKKKEWPFWNTQIATGFPQIGIPAGLFNPVNLFLFYFLPMPLAFNLGLAATFLTTAIFTYLFARLLTLSKIASVFTATIFTFSGIFVTQIVHYSVIQTLALFPLELYLAELFIQKRKGLTAVLLALTFGVQILTGFFQVVVYSLIVLTAYIFWRIFFMSQEELKTKAVITVLILILVGLGFAVAAVQLLPSFEFTQISNRAEGVSLAEIRRFPYPLKHVITFIWPYLLGDPRIGSYPKFSENWGIFWESTGYLGILPLILALAAVIIHLRRNKIVQFFFILLVISFLLMLGKNFPTFFLFQIPPLSFFRVPARWIMFLVFSLSILAGIGFEILKLTLEAKGKQIAKILIPILVLILATVNIFIFALNYHPRGKAKNWLQKTQTAKFLENDSSIFRVITLGNEIVWNEQFLKKGWLGSETSYLNFMEGLDPNWNMIQGIDHTSSYGILISKRDLLMRTIVESNIAKTDNGYSLNRTAIKLLGLQNVKYIISPAQISGPTLEKVFETNNQPKYFIYENKSVMPRVFVVESHIASQVPAEQVQILSHDKFFISRDILLEKNLGENFKQTKVQANFSAQITKFENQNVEIAANLKNDGILILADSFYPGWKAKIDGKETEILAANINQRAIIVPAGEHNIKFSFEPGSFKIGAIISVTASISLIILGLLISFKPRSKKAINA